MKELSPIRGEIRQFGELTRYKLSDIQKINIHDIYVMDNDLFVIY